MISAWLNDIKLFFYPQLCVLCDNLLHQSERGICIICETNLNAFPFSFFDGNPIAQLFYYNTPISGGNAFLNFVEGGKTQKMLHSIKYKGNKTLALFIGEKAGENALQQNPEYKPDVIIPVPLHFIKQEKRGYNQSELLARGMNTVWNAKIDIKSVIRSKETDTQTKKARYNRFENMKGVFETKIPENIAGKHVLIVDDMITTGATISSLCSEILKNKPASLVIYALAFKY